MPTPVSSNFVYLKVYLISQFDTAFEAVVS